MSDWLPPFTQTGLEPAIPCSQSRCVAITLLDVFLSGRESNPYLLIRNQLFYPLNYLTEMVVRAGVEPASLGSKPSILSV